MSELTDLTAVRLVDGYRKGEFSPVDVVRAALRRAEETQPLVNAFVRIEARAALEQAEASAGRWRRGEPRGLVDGVPVSVKDLLLLRGGPTLRGSRTLRAEARGTRTPLRWRGCGSTARCSSAARPPRSSAGRA